jgi:hypothetical protein
MDLVVSLIGPVLSPPVTSDLPTDHVVLEEIYTYLSIL